MFYGIERFHSRDQDLCKFIETKGRVYIRKEFNSLRIGLEHQHGRRFIVLEHQYRRRDVMWKRKIVSVYCDQCLCNSVNAGLISTHK